MNVLIVSASPNQEGLTAACAKAAAEGARAGHADVVQLDLSRKSVAACRQCDNGWGLCRSEHDCITKDDFQELHRAVLSAGALVLVTPVYWGEMSESAKVFTDKLRRCEATRGEGCGLRDKPVVCVAAAGGSGNGSITCLASMERLLDHLHAAKRGLVSVTRSTREAMLPAIQKLVQSMVGDTEP